MHFPPPPPEIKGVQHFMKLAEDHEERNLTVSYYCRMGAVELAMKICPGQKSKEVQLFLVQILDWLEKTKKAETENEGIQNDMVGRAQLEDYMLKLYNFAYNAELENRFDKVVVKSYYTASLLGEVLLQFQNPLPEEIATKLKTAKFRATYIHNMLKSGQTPTPINVQVLDEDGADEDDLLISKDEVNRRRANRGEDPIDDTNTEQLTPEQIEERRKALEELRKRGNPELEEELRRAKEKIDADAEQDEDMQNIFKPSIPQGPIIPDRIINMGPAEVPEQPNTFQVPGPAPAPTPTFPQPPPQEYNSAGNTVASLQPDQSEKASKYCKWAASALTHDDVETAIENLEKALHLCRYGREKE